MLWSDWWKLYVCDKWMVNMNFWTLVKVNYLLQEIYTDDPFTEGTIAGILIIKNVISLNAKYIILIFL